MEPTEDNYHPDFEPLFQEFSSLLNNTDIPFSSEVATTQKDWKARYQNLTTLTRHPSFEGTLESNPTQVINSLVMRKDLFSSCWLKGRTDTEVRHIAKIFIRILTEEKYIIDYITSKGPKPKENWEKRPTTSTTTTPTLPTIPTSPFVPRKLTFSSSSSSGQDNVKHKKTQTQELFKIEEKSVFFLRHNIILHLKRQIIFFIFLCFFVITQEKATSSKTQEVQQVRKTTT